MNNLLPILLGLNLFLFVSLSSGNQCQGIKAPDGTAYDISSLNSAVYEVTQVLGESSYVYNISLCSTLGASTCDSCEASPGVCQTWVGGSACCGVYPAATISGLNGGHGVVLHYINGLLCRGCVPSGPRETYVYIFCGSGAGLNHGAMSGGETGATPVFNATFISNAACPGGGSLSGGWIFIIIFFCVLFVYVVGGIIFNIAVRKANGKEVFPNSGFWCEVPGLMKDGGICLKNKCSGKTGYTSV